MYIYELMTSHPHIIHADATIQDVAMKMQTSGCGILPVGFHEHIVGVITDRDVINRVIAQHRNPEKTFVSEVMSANPIFCYQDDRVRNAIKQMNKYKIRRILAMDNQNKLVGVLSVIDIFRRLKDKSMLEHLFADAMLL